MVFICCVYYWDTSNLNFFYLFPVLQLCQWTPSFPDLAVGIGSLESVKYTVKDYDPDTKSVSLLATYTLGYGDRISKVEFVYDKTVKNPELLVIDEEPSNTFVRLCMAIEKLPE
jgi:hypothetical protein